MQHVLSSPGRSHQSQKEEPLLQRKKYIPNANQDHHPDEEASDRERFQSQWRLALTPESSFLTRSTRCGQIPSNRNVRLRSLVAAT
jgi:hypothetical protein